MSGFFSGLGKELDRFGRDLSRGADSVSKSITNTVNEQWNSSLLETFKSGNVVQLVSRSSGRTLQIVSNATGHLVIDGMGPEGPECCNAHWNVTNHGKNIVSLVNQNNYISVVNGITQIVSFPDPMHAGIETRFRLVQTGQFICFESVREGGRHLGILNSGQLKSALATGREIDGQFGVRLIYTPYVAQPAQPAGPHPGYPYAGAVPPPYKH